MKLTETVLGYDANGNALGVYPASQTYDVENRVSSAGQYNIPQVLYAYDPHNRRVWKGNRTYGPILNTQTLALRSGRVATGRFEIHGEAKIPLV